jgi:hypothetical protein
LTTAVQRITDLRDAGTLVESDALVDLTGRMAAACADIGRAAPR